MKHNYSTNISGTDDCCGNCTAYEYYLKVPKCKEINPTFADFRPIPQGMCPKHNRATCMKCGTPVHYPLASMCEDCKKALIEEANNETLIDIRTSEVIGKRKDIALIGSEIDLF